MVWGPRSKREEKVYTACKAEERAVSGIPKVVAKKSLQKSHCI